MPLDDQYREQRFEFVSVVLPFLGSREEDHLCFQYIPLDISTHGLKLAVPKWVVEREKLRDGDIVNLHVPFRMSGVHFNRGRILWSTWDETIHSQVCGIRMEKGTPLHCPVFIAIDTGEGGINLQEFTSEEVLILRILKDSILLKKGVLIYLNHLVPYFSRVTSYPADEYPMLKEFLFDDVRRRIGQNIERLESLYQRAQAELPSRTEIPLFLDLEEVRSIIKSEIYLDLFKTAFATETILPFLSAVKELEKKQYTNYNTLVMLYLKSL